MRGIASFLVVSLLVGVVLGQQPAAQRPEAAPAPAQPAAGGSAPPLLERPMGPGGGSLAPSVPKKGSLEDLLQQALKSNPDIRAAEAKVREAEAALNQVRMQVMQKIVGSNHRINMLKVEVAHLQKHQHTLEKLMKQGVMSDEKLREAEVQMQKARAELAKAEAEMPFLLGQAPRGVLGTHLGLWADSTLRAQDPNSQKLDCPYLQRAPVVSGQNQCAQCHHLSERIVTIAPTAAPVIGLARADSIRRALNEPTKVQFQNVTVRELLDYFRERVKGVNFHQAVALPEKWDMSLKLPEQVPLGAVFQLLEDQYGWRFVVREYGIVVVDRTRVPPGAVFLQNIWKESQPKQVTPPGPQKAPPQE
jgi:hypothetical protein